MQEDGKVYLLQPISRNKRKQEAIDIELENQLLKIKLSNDSCEVSLYSKSFIFMYGEKTNSDNVEHEFVILPSFNQNKLQFLSGYNSIVEDFFYSDDYYKYKLNFHIIQYFSAQNSVVL